MTSSVDILPRAGERWRILGQDAGPETVWTSICEGSVRLDGPAHADPGLAAATGGPVGSAPGIGLFGILAWLGALLGSRTTRGRLIAGPVHRRREVCPTAAAAS